MHWCVEAGIAFCEGSHDLLQTRGDVQDSGALYLQYHMMAQDSDVVLSYCALARFVSLECSSGQANQAGGGLWARGDAVLLNSSVQFLGLPLGLTSQQTRKTTSDQIAEEENPHESDQATCKPHPGWSGVRNILEPRALGSADRRNADPGSFVALRSLRAPTQHLKACPAKGRLLNLCLLLVEKIPPTCLSHLSISPSSQHSSIP